MKKTRIVDLSLHGLRHTFARHPIVKGVDSRTVQNCFDHSAIQVTGKYSRLSKSRKREAIEVLDSWRDIETELK